MALAGLLTAASTVLGATGMGQPEPASSSRAEAKVTTATTLTSGQMTQQEASPLFLLLFGLALYWAFKR